MPVVSNEIVCGYGDLYFGRFIAGTTTPDGEVYLGETQSFSILRDITSLARKTSYDGQAIDLEGIVVTETHSAKFVTDNLSVDNLALWFGGDALDTEQVDTIDMTETLTLKRGRYYQLGLSVQPSGLKNLASIHPTKLGVAINLDANFESDFEAGRIFVRTDAPDVIDGTVVVFTFDLRPADSKTIISAKKELIGSLRFVAKNIYGENKNVFFPYVHLKIEGELSLKTSDWENLSFSVSARRLKRGVEFVYIEQVVVGNQTAAEAAIIAEGIALSDFPYWEDILNTITNINIPAHHYEA